MCFKCVFLMYGFFWCFKHLCKTWKLENILVEWIDICRNMQNINIYIHIYMCVHICICIFIYAYIYIYIYMNIYTYMYTHMWCIYMCTYIYVYDKYMHTHIFIHIDPLLCSRIRACASSCASFLFLFHTQIWGGYDE